MTTGAQAGIGVGVAVAVLAIVVGVFLWIRRSRHKVVPGPEGTRPWSVAVEAEGLV